MSGSARARRARGRRSVRAALVLGACLSLVLPAAGLGHHTDFLDRRWENNWIPDPTVTFYAVGTGWTTAAFDRLDGAADEWYAYSAFKPIVLRWQTGDPTFKSIYRMPPPGIVSDPDGYICEIASDAVAASCVTPFGVNYPHPFRIKNVRVVFNSTFSLMGPIYYGTGTNCADGSCLNFEGVATHELGHAGGLWDMPCSWYSGSSKLPSTHTMCPIGPVPPYTPHAWQSHYQRTVESDDVQSMDDLY